MTTTCRPWWRNCALGPDPEILAIDRMEDRIAPLSDNLTKIRALITGLELCHHKAERWVANIIEAIGAGMTCKGLGRRPAGRHHPAETVWQGACATLSAWVAGCPAASVDLTIDRIPASDALLRLGARSPLKEWQVQRVVEKIRSAIHWPEPGSDPAAQYVSLLLDGSEYGVGYRDQCPVYYKDHEAFWWKTVRTRIRDAVNGSQAELSLAIAIDMLMPCHWRFVTNLQIVLDAIGGRLDPTDGFAACGRNISLLPMRDRMDVVCRSLKVFCGTAESDERTDLEALAQLGEPTEAKRWLAASLDKTIRLQLDPPAELRSMSALAGPEWLGTER